jgi:hypothetical protein
MQKSNSEEYISYAKNFLDNALKDSDKTISFMTSKQDIT